MQSGFFVLHTLAMIMKIHSYLSMNRSFAAIHLDLTASERELREQVIAVHGGTLVEAWGKALDSTGIIRAHQFQALLEPPSGDDAAGARRWAQMDLQQGAAASDKRVRLYAQEKERSVPRVQSPVSARRGVVDSFEMQVPQTKEVDLRDPHPFMYHPDESISRPATEIGQLREQLYAQPSQGTDPGPMWPANVTYSNFWDYLLVPALVYQLKYPRTERVRYLYVLERVLATFGTFFVVYVITVIWILPLSPSTDKPVYAVFLQLAVPMMLNYLLIFYIMFECVCNGFAELTRFAHREFYQDWWNSTTMAEFSRKWNKPVHHFLLQHVYASLITSWGLSKQASMLLTLFLSSILHEIVMIIVSGKLRGYLFFMQMMQFPLVFLAQIPFIKNDPALGNLIFWLGLLVGFPLLNIAYLVY